MLDHTVIIEKFESAYKHLGQCAEQYNKNDISFWEQAGMIDSISANVLRYINETISNNGGKFIRK